MQIDVNEDAARLRRRQTIVKCQSDETEASACDCAAGDCNAPPCQDCGDCVIDCRCSPGEG